MDAKLEKRLREVREAVIEVLGPAMCEGEDGGGAGRLADAVELAFCAWFAAACEARWPARRPSREELEAFVRQAEERILASVTGEAG